MLLKQLPGAFAICQDGDQIELREDRRVIAWVCTSFDTDTIQLSPHTGIKEVPAAALLALLCESKACTADELMQAALDRGS